MVAIPEMRQTDAGGPEAGAMSEAGAEDQAELKEAR